MARNVSSDILDLTGQLYTIEQAPTGIKAKIMNYIDKVSRYHLYIKQAYIDEGGDGEINQTAYAHNVKSNSIIYRLLKNLYKIYVVYNRYPDDYLEVINAINMKYNIVWNFRLIFGDIYDYINEMVYHENAHHFISQGDKVKIIRKFHKIADTFFDRRTKKKYKLNEIEEGLDNDDEYF